MDKTAETIILKSDAIYKKDVSFSRLSDCVIYAYGTPGTVHISDVYRCEFVIGPVSGSVFVER